jgi:Mor family transcriptional regulator
MSGHRPTLDLVPPPAGATAPRPVWPAEQPPPRLRRDTARFLGRLAGHHPEADFLHRWPATLVTLRDIAEAALRHCQAQGQAVDPHAAARAVVVAIADYLGGGRIDLPTTTKVKRALRDAEIWRAFDGRNAAMLAERYQMPLRTVYYVLQQQRRLRQRLRAQRLGRL